MTIDIYSVISLLLIQLYGTEPIGTATGFLWKDVTSSQYYLVTNYHVLSGKHPVKRRGQANNYP
jgi:S1-C subfamily serine protease